jgi:hypothetical protein
VTATVPRVRVGCLALLAGVLFTTAAWAAPKRIGVPKFDGVQEALVRKKVMQILKAHGYDLAKSREMEIGLANTGALLDNDEGFQKVAKELALAAIVTGEVGKKRAKIAVHDGKDGSLLGEAAFAGANPRAIMAEVGRSFWTKLGGEVERGKTPSGSKKPQKVVAEAPEDDEKTPDAAGEGSAEEPPPPPTKKKKEEPVAAAEGGGEGEEAPPPPKKKKKKKQMRMEQDVVEEEGPEVIPPTLDIQAGLGFINRALVYHEDASTPGLRPYGLPAGPSFVANVVWYPIGPFTDGPLKNLGFEANLELGFLISSSLGADSMCAVAGMPIPADCFPMGAKFSTSVHEYTGGARYRTPFGGGHYFWGSLTGGEHAFTFHTENTSDATMSRGRLLIPDTIYRFVRPGVGLHFQLPAQISLSLSGGFRYVFNSGGQFHDYFFPFSTVNGVDAQGVIGYRITPMIEARVVADFRRYFSSMNCAASGPSGTTVNRCDATNSTHPNQNFTAGGAIDQYLSFSAVIAVTMGGSEIAMPEEEEPPPPPKRKRKVQSEDEEPGAGDSGGGGDEQ